MTLIPNDSGVIAFILRFSPISIAWLANYVTLVEYRRKCP